VKVARAGRRLDLYRPELIIEIAVEAVLPEAPR
jgi:hypothetical protein